jgi:RPEL repeat protein
MLTLEGNRALQSVQHDLERQKITDNLRKGLEHRPEREELVERMCFLFLVL